MSATQRSSSPFGGSQTGSSSGVDHISTHRFRLSQKEYPEDCPPFTVKWHYAVDIPKRKPFQEVDNAKPVKAPSKFVPFGQQDSRAIEAAYQKISQEEDAKDAAAASKPWTTRGVDDYLGSGEDLVQASLRASGNLKKKVKMTEEEDVTVPVNEDYLFDVNVKKRELAPAYWDGPVYQVLRGTWFVQEGAILRPLDESLSAQIEEGYLQFKPFRSKPATLVVPNSPPKVSDTKDEVTPETGTPSKPEEVETPKVQTPVRSISPAPPAQQHQQQQQQTWRLLGAHLNSFVVYVDATTAWLLSDDMYGKITSTIYQRITSGQNMGGIRLVRGWSEKAPAAAVVKDKVASGSQTPRPSTPTLGKAGKSQPPPTKSPLSKIEGTETPETAGRIALERKMSNLLGIDVNHDEPEKLMEEEMKEDYKDSDENEQDREIDHLILVTHGIGQRLSLRMESVNFIHDVNVFRKTLKAVYGVSPDLQALNEELDHLPPNCRVQVLPICWRHLLDFPKQALRANRLNATRDSADDYSHDLGHGEPEDIYESYPSLDDITVEGVPAVRSLITDLALDILLYQSAYRSHIAKIVLKEANRVYNLFVKRNPGWNGRVSMVGHSLGSAILFDILCRQGIRDRQVGRGLDFYCENFFAYGSPIGLFQMLEGKTIASRIPPNFKEDPSPPSTPMHFNVRDPFSFPKEDPYDPNISSPLCTQLFNIFHPTDPISYRLEPLVTKAMAEMKPQLLPYTKKNLLSNQLAGLTGIGQRVTNMWSNFSSGITAGIASSILNRSLGFSGDGPPVPLEKKKDEEIWFDEEEEVGKPTLIDGELETLYAGFQRRRTLKKKKEKKSGSGKDTEQTTSGASDVETEEEEILEDTTEGARKADEKAKRLKREERKLRALNRTGRIDFAIQEGTFDISLIASIASHLSYWSDEDVNSFVLSQLLSRKKPKTHRLGALDASKLMVEE